MAHILIMPRQGNTVESCIITNWKVKEGDEVTADTAICEVETDKAAFEIPAGAAGTVLKLLYTPGDDVPVLQPIAVIGSPGEDWKNVLGSREQGVGNRDTSSNDNLSFPSPCSPLSISPRARNLAAKEALPTETVPGTGPGGRIVERDVAAALQKRPPLTAAAKAAGQGTIPTQGTGFAGRITVTDLLQPSKPSTPHSPFPDPLVPIKGIRKIIADRMMKSLAETAQLTLNASAQAAKLQETRSVLKAHGVTINDLVLFAVSRTLNQFPYMNAHKIGDAIRTFERVHLGFAVDTERGLMVPVIRNADMLSLALISSEAKRLAAACQAGSVKPDELSGSTFTVTNLGSLGITSFTPVLNIPEVAILGVCAIEIKAGASDAGISFTPHIGLSLTINHQVIDGAPAARFLNGLSETIAQIDLLLAAG